MAIGNLGPVALGEERWDDGVELLLAALRLNNRWRNRRGAVEALLALAMAFAALEDARTAVELEAAFEALCAAAGIDPAAADLLLLRATPLLDWARVGLDPATVEALAARGRSLTPEKALERLESQPRPLEAKTRR